MSPNVALISIPLASASASIVTLSAFRSNNDPPSISTSLTEDNFVIPLPSLPIY